MAAPSPWRQKAMEIKFEKKLSDYDYLVMFDLATRSTGVCVWSLPEGKPLWTTNITTTGKTGNRARELWDGLDRFFLDFSDKLGEGAFPKTLVHRELCPVQQGRFTTAKTLISLGKAHAILDLYLSEKGLDYYDLEGVSPSTTHSYFRRLRGLGPKDKVEKEDVRAYLAEEVGIDPALGLDESDAMFLAKTFQEVYWDKQLDEEIKEKKKHRKTLKAPAALASVDREIERLKSLKRKKEE